MPDLVPIEQIQHAILTIRGQRVMLDADLAELYQVETRILVRNVKRNLARFPADFMFQLGPDEFTDLRSQFGIPSSWGGRRFPPFAFTEQGVAMLSSVLHSERAVAVNIEIMRAFVRLRQVAATQDEILRRLDSLEAGYFYHDARIGEVFEAIRQLMTPAAPGAKRIGFRPDDPA